MYTFTTEESKFLKQLSESNDGLVLKDILRNVRISISDISKMGTTSDYGAQVEGRKIAIQFIDSILEKMSKRDSGMMGGDLTKRPVGEDNFD